MASISSNVVFNDIFIINEIDPEGKKYDRGQLLPFSVRASNRHAELVSRLFAHSNNYDMDLTLDYNTELYPLRVSESFSLVLASSLARGGEAATNGVDGSEEEKDTNVWRPDGKGRRGLEEDYEYVMYGRVRLTCSALVFCF